MPTQTPKHKRVLRDGQTSRGPARWARAAGNAFSKPNSKGGRLYLKRTTVAYLVSEQYSNTEGPFGHMTVSWMRPGWAVTDTVNYYTCSLYCAVMVVQLDHSEVNDVGGMIGFLMEDDRAPRHMTPTRTVRCYCCGTDIKP